MTQPLLIEGPQPPRPSGRSDEIYKRAGELFAQDIAEALNEPETDMEQLAEDCTQALKMSGPDGYDIAKFFERELNYDGIDATFVEYADMGTTRIHEAQDEVVSAWIEKYDIKPKFEIGKKFTAPGRWFNQNPVMAMGQYPAEIRKIYKDRADYGIYCATFCKDSTEAYLIHYETVEAQIENWKPSDAELEQAKIGEGAHSML